MNGLTAVSDVVLRWIIDLALLHDLAFSTDQLQWHRGERAVRIPLVAQRARSGCLGCVWPGAQTIRVRADAPPWGTLEVGDAESFEVQDTARVRVYMLEALTYSAEQRTIVITGEPNLRVLVGVAKLNVRLIPAE